MKTVALVSCVKTKRSGTERAYDLFSKSALFRLSYGYAQSLHPDAILLLTTEYGLVRPDDVLHDYDRSPNLMTAAAWREWGQRVLRQLRRNADPDVDRFVFVTGRKYSAPLIPHLRHYELPLTGMRIGKRKQFLKMHADKVR